MYPKAIWSDQLKQGMEFKLFGRDCVITDTVKQNERGEYVVHFAIIHTPTYGTILMPKYQKIEILNEHL